jgi:hypothetical protein
MRLRHKAAVHKPERELLIPFHLSCAEGAEWLRDRRRSSPQQSFWAVDEGIPSCAGMVGVMADRRGPG